MSTEIVENNLSPRIECTKNGKTIEIDEKSEVVVCGWKKKVEKKWAYKNSHKYIYIRIRINSKTTFKKVISCMWVGERILRWKICLRAQWHQHSRRRCPHHYHTNKQSNKDIHELWFFFFFFFFSSFERKYTVFLCSATRAFVLLCFWSIRSVFRFQTASMCVYGLGWLCGPFNTTLSHIHPIPRSLSFSIS